MRVFDKGFYTGLATGIGIAMVAYLTETDEILDPNMTIVFGDPDTPCHVTQTLEEHLALIDFDKTLSPKINALYMAWPYLCMESEGAFEEEEQP